ncbi:META domain-containing protein [Flavobacterium daejeonense]|uniref:META domain-containing protein n=1 Tax=Flavobacterium daejeonense TaxID=350893 RepID=UPI00047A98BA|nr:META domain-containing protein [Flavobacterium daejeonense]
MKNYIGLGILSILLFSCSSNKKITTSNQLQEKYWKLIEIRGQKVTSENYLKEPHFILKAKENRITGNSGCNSFSGTYELTPETNRIAIYNIAMTRMACIKPTVEEAFIKVLETADNYTVKNDTLQLNKARMAPMAKFVAVYLK